MNDSKTDSAEPRNDLPSLAKWVDRELDKGTPGVVAAIVAIFIIALAILVVQLTLVVVLLGYVYPLANGTYEKVAAVLAGFGALSVFLVELRSLFSSTLTYQFLTRKRKH